MPLPSMRNYLPSICLFLCAACGGRVGSDADNSATGAKDSERIEGDGGEQNIGAAGEQGGDGDQEPEQGAGGSLPSNGGAPGAGGAASLSSGGASLQINVGGTLTGSGGSATGGSATGGSATGGSGGGVGFCAFGSFDTDLNDESLTCAPWSVCQPGSYQTESGSYTADRICAPCPEGSFQKATSSFACDDWTICAFGQDVDVPGTTLSDVSCKASSKFAAYRFEGSTYPYDLTATGEAIYLLTSEYEYYEDEDEDEDEVGTEILRFTLDGASLPSWTMVPIALGMANIDDDIYLTTIGSDGVDDRAIEFMKLDSSGSLVWERSLGELGDDAYEAQIAADDEFLYISTIRYISDNEETVSIGSYAQDGDLRWKTDVDLGVAYPYVHDLEVATDGHVYLSGTRYLEQDEGFVFEFDETGELVAEHTTETLGCEWVRSLAADASGKVYVVGAKIDPDTGNRSGTVLNVLGPEGAHSLNITIPLEVGESITDLVVTSSGLHLIGESGSALLFLLLDTEGTVISRTVYDDHQGWVSGITSAPDESVFFSGGAWSTSGRVAFVWPWVE